MKALETMIQNMFHKDCAACTDQEVYEALLTYTKEQLAAKGYHDGRISEKKWQISCRN